MKAKKTKLALWICAIVVLLVASILVPSVQKTETIQVTMRDAVLHETNRISLFGIKDVNPALISAMVVSGILLVFAVIVRIFVIPRFKMVPGKFQMLLEQAVDLFDGMAKSNTARGAAASSVRTSSRPARTFSSVRFLSCSAFRLSQRRVRPSRFRRRCPMSTPPSPWAASRTSSFWAAVSRITASKAWAAL